MDDETGTNPWQGKFEVLALLALLGGLAVVASVGLGAYAQHRELESMGGSGGPVWVLRQTVAAISPLVAALVVASFLFVVEGPGDRFGALGRFVLWAIVAVGLFLAVGAAGCGVDWLIRDGDTASGVNAFPIEGASWLERAGSALPAFAAAAVLGYVAWCTWNLLAPAALTEGAPPDAADGETWGSPPSQVDLGDASRSD